MATTKIAVTIDEKTLTRLDKLVKSEIFPNRSKAVQAAISEKLERLDKVRLARECAKLDPNFERSIAEEGMDFEEWPEY